MKYQFKIAVIIVLVALFAANGFSQSAKEINYEGLKIIFKKTSKEVVTASLFIKGGVANIADDQQGLESIALSLALDGGTRTMNKDEFAALSDKLGTNFGSNAANDYSSMTMQCLAENLDKSWDMFTDVIMNPAMDSNEFSLIKQQMISNAKQQDANPDAYLRRLTEEHVRP